METLASQYYAQIGIGGMARPMVVGDRLWLFSQTPNGPAPVQSMMLNNTPALPIPPLRGFPSTPNSPILDSARNALLSRGQPLNYGISKSMPPFPMQTPFLNRLSPHFKPYDTFMANKFQQTAPLSPHFPSKPNHFAKFNNRNNNFYGNSICDDSDSYIQLKYSTQNGPFGAIGSDGSALPNETTTTNGIAELERAFGDRNSILDPLKTEKGLNGRLKDEYPDNGSDDASTSDIDCEEIDENDI